MGELDLHLLGEGRHEGLWRHLGAHVRVHQTVTGTSFAVWAPNARVGAGGRRLQQLGRPDEPDADAGRIGRLGDLPARRRRRRALQVRGAHPAGPSRPPRRPVRVRHRGAAVHGQRGVRRVVHLARRRLAGRPGGRRRDDLADVGLRGAPRLLAAGRGRRRRLAPDDLPGAGRRAAGVCQRSRLHPRGAAAGRRAPVRRLLGLPGDRLLRADRAVRLTRRLPVSGRPAAPGRDRRDRRLGGRPLPQGRLGAGAVRRHRPLRARRPAAGRASGLGHPGLQLRPARGAQLPARERAVLDRGVPHRRAAGGRRGLDALPRLLPLARPVGAQPVRREGEPGGHRFHQGDERGRLPASSVGVADRRGIDVLARRVPADATSAAWASASSGTWAG